MMIEPTQYYQCTRCSYTTSRKSDYSKHLLTRKHQQRESKFTNVYLADDEFITNESDLEYSFDEDVLNTIECLCGKKYSSRQSLHVHQKKCKLKNIDSHDNYENFIKVNESIIVELIRDNRELREILVEQNKTIQEIAKNNTLSMSTNINNNSNNKTFNLNFFLNEECKNAINMSDFVNSIEFGLDDLEETGRLGFVEGISKVVIKNLTDLDINLRPIHCGDIKREVLYIKNDDKWEKDSKSKNIIKCAIQEIANKNIKKISEWIKCHPDCQNSESTQNTKYLNIVLNSMSGSTIEEQQSNYEKIITRVAKEVAIKKY
jgi:hypothetical protein